LFGDCCARAASGHAAAVLPTNLMNSRRLMALPVPGPSRAEIYSKSKNGNVPAAR
jgi:hypothetical protein